MMDVVFRPAQRDSGQVKLEVAVNGWDFTNDEVLFQYRKPIRVRDSKMEFYEFWKMNSVCKRCFLNSKQQKNEESGQCC